MSILRECQCCFHFLHKCSVNDKHKCTVLPQWETVEAEHYCGLFKEGRSKENIKNRKIYLKSFESEEETDIEVERVYETRYDCQIGRLVAA